MTVNTNNRNKCTNRHKVEANSHAGPNSQLPDNTNALFFKI